MRYPEYEYSQERLADEVEHVIVVALGRMDDEETARSLWELEALVEAAGGIAVERVLQPLDRPTPATYIGKGKVDEIEALALSLDADIVVFDTELTPVQNRNLVDKLPCKVLDRTELILDIFAQRAQSREGKLQVELAQLQYNLPRLTGRGTMMSRIGGGARAGSGPIGTRGPGRTKLEVDRSQIQHRIARLRKTLKEVGKRRGLTRTGRQASGLPSAGLVGYTNAGKSSLLNALAGSEEVSTRNRLFETLDTTARRISLDGDREAIVSDTVGLLRDLPHHLVAAFRATLEEAAQADVLVQVIDVSDQDRDKQQAATSQVLEDLGVSDLPMVHALNKVDLVADREVVEELAESLPNAVVTSAKTGEGIERLRAVLGALLVERLAAVTLEVPYDSLHLLNVPANQGRVLNYQYEADRVIAEAELGAAALGRLKEYVVAEG